MSPVPVIDAPLLDAPLAIQETSSSDSSAEFDRPQSTAFNTDNDDERSEETEGLLNEVLESADRIYSRHVHGMQCFYRLNFKVFSIHGTVCVLLSTNTLTLSRFISRCH